MKQKKKLIKSAELIIGVVLLISIIGLVSINEAEQGNIKQVEGLFYLDHAPVRIEIEDGKISRFTRIEELSNDSEHFYIGPGLIDSQVNGYMGVSFVDMGGELTYEGVKKISEAFWKVGTTSFFPTLTTNDQAIYIKNFALLAQAMKNPGLRGSIAGLHLEGPYISPVDGFRGAHPLKYVRKPDWDEFMDMYDASEKNIRVVTVAPEIEGAMDFISKSRDMGIAVGLGHHNGNSQQITEAIDRGAQVSTHLGNGMANMINRHANPLWPQLSDDRLMISIIADGFHLRPEQIRVFHKSKGSDKTILISDVSALGGLPPGYYLNVIGDTLEVTPDGAVVYPELEVLAGSASPLIKGIGHVMKVTGCSLGEAIHMATRNPANLYGLDDRGVIRPGMRADLILFTMDDFEMDIKETIVGGETVYEKSN